MSENHYRKKLSAYLDHELPAAERRLVAEHLEVCADCRREFDRIKLAAAFAVRLPRADAPPEVWNKIENSLNENEKRQKSLFPHFSDFRFSGLEAAGLCFVCLLLTLAYFSFFKPEPGEIAKTKTPNSHPSIQIQTKITAVWAVEALAGTPRTGNEKIAEKGNLTIGETLETDGAARARIAVADIGNIEIAPNSRVRLVETSAAEHRLALERGVLRAQIFAPPRLFVVDTPSGKAVDLGCAYTLEVDADGSNRLHVTSGYVALEQNGREVVVPAGAVALAKRGKGLGTPFSDDASPKLQAALDEFDFENGGRRSLRKILKYSDAGDALTLWHLLTRARQGERAKVFDRLAAYVKPPAAVTRRGILDSDQKMLDAWRTEIENRWFER